MAEGVQRTAQQLSQPGSARAAIRTSLLRHAAESSGGTGRRGCLIVAMATEQAHDPDIAARARTMFERLQTLYAAAIVRGQANGEFAERDPQAMARFLVCQIQGMRVLGKTGSLRRSHATASSRSTRAAPLGDVRHPAGRLLSAAARLLHRQRGAAFHSGRPWRIVLGRANGHFLVCRAVCGHADYRRAPRRPFWPQPRILPRLDGIHRRLAAVRFRLVALGPHCRARAAGHHRCGHGAAGTRLRPGHFSGVRKTAGAQPVRCGVWPGLGYRAGAGRCPDRAEPVRYGMARGIPGQPAVGPAGDPVRHPAVEADRRTRFGQAGPRRHGLVDADAGAADRTADRRPRGRMALVVLAVAGRRAPAGPLLLALRKQAGAGRRGAAA
ncbi:conserved hypothetical protein [Ricinus communis]|uniref:Transcriptional regulator LmrA/YxaF-like C-terminal domain-containing protein n=1 Tax=Ricinus communis TaxID=3988 RepID=B9TG54_RICCO|nr:conserved hypothetical protein [Ricinus communis]